MLITNQVVARVRASVIDQDVTHHLRADREEVRAVCQRTG